MVSSSSLTFASSSEILASFSSASAPSAAAVSFVSSSASAIIFFRHLAPLLVFLLHFPPSSGQPVMKIIKPEDIVKPLIDSELIRL